MKPFDVIVVGAGPAGATAGLILAEAGCSVAILEKERLPRYKVCGGGLVLRARKVIPELHPDIIEREFFKIQWGIPSSQMSFSVERNYPVITMIMRDKLDHFLVSKATDHGAKIFDRTKLTGLSKNGSWKLVTGAGDKWTANHIIAADGALGPTAKLLHIPDDRYLIPALEAEVTVDNPEDYHDARFDIDATPKGYGWVFPKKNHLSIGIASAVRGKVNLRAAYKRYLALLRIATTRNENIYGFQIPVRPRKTVSQKGVLLTGDAAGFADPLVAEGISQAVISGKLAAQSIVEADGDPNLSYRIYDKLVKIQIQGQNRTGKILSHLFYNYPRLRKIILSRKGQELSEYFTDVFSGSRNYPEKTSHILNSFRKAIF